MISSFAESVGIPKLEKDIYDLLCSDLESKLLEIIQVGHSFQLFNEIKEGKKFMRHAKRDFLKTDDIKHSMEKLSIPVISLKPTISSIECLWLSLFHPLYLRERPKHSKSLVHQVPSKHLINNICSIFRSKNSPRSLESSLQSTPAPTRSTSRPSTAPSPRSPKPSIRIESLFQAASCSPRTL